ncbi:MAG: hypothetical protein M0Z39_06570 [Actinomycetota bacterium]|jgi:RNA polymerase sigma factor (sigma-70 family)|nr:hypothetical protein [Actinomycetota bacterium]
MHTLTRTFGELVKDFQEGDQGAFPELMPLLSPVVNATVRRFYGAGRSGAAKEDFLQEAWMAVHHALGKYDLHRFPDLQHQFFRNAVVMRLEALNEHNHILGMRRPIKRFLYEVLSDKVDWSLSDIDLAKSYPGVTTNEIASARDHGAAQWTVVVTDWLHNYPDQHEGANASRLRAVVESPWDTDADVRAEAAKDFFKSFMDELTDLEQQVFELRFLKGSTRVETSVALNQTVWMLRRVERGLFAKCPGGCRLSPGEVWREVWYNR